MKTLNRKSIKSMARVFVVLTLSLVGFSLCANEDKTIVDTSLFDSIENELVLKDLFGIDFSGNSMISKSKKIRTHIITFQYVNGWLQHVAIYPEYVIFTNMEGPREGVQLIIANNGAIMDICQFGKERKDHATHKYAWGEVRTYK